MNRFWRWTSCPLSAPHLTLPNHVHRLITLNHSSRSLEFTKPWLSVHSPFDRAMVLLEDVVQTIRNRWWHRPNRSPGTGSTSGLLPEGKFHRPATTCWSASRPRSSSSSSTSRSNREYRRYQRTAQRMSGRSVCRHLKIVGRVAIVTILSRCQHGPMEVATHSFRCWILLLGVELENDSEEEAEVVLIVGRRDRVRIASQEVVELCYPNSNVI